MASAKRIILITGTNSGIGYDTSFALANASPENHVVMSARSAERGKKALSEIQGRVPKGTLSFLELDVASDASISAAVQKLTSDFGVVDVLVNNAGMADRGPVTRKSLHDIFDVNLFGPVLLTQALEPLLQLSKDPRIVNLSTNLGSVAIRTDLGSSPNYAQDVEAYRLTKAALNMMTASQYYHYVKWKHPAKVWSYCPGYVVTNLDPAGPQNMASRGAGSSETSAAGIVEIVGGKRDGEVNSFITTNGGTYPW
ncbi:hypothetical protein F5Y15DRAFT_70377 [Xylariaceae sp. FL0016]|nr:hypothetical protein F5Y15DRAFT_70377 [Xylariaceae sp. FL0016]